MIKFIKHTILCFKYLFKHCSISYYSNISSRSVLEGYNIIEKNAVLKNSYVGKFSYVAYETILDRVKVGRFSSIGPRCIVGLAEHPIKNFVSTHPLFYSKMKFWMRPFSENKRFKFNSYRSQNAYAVEIGSDVWIGAGVMILDGVNIADGSIIAAGSVVTKPTEPFGIYAGIPARMIRKRDQINDPLVTEKWWNKDLDTISALWKNFLR